MKQKKFYLSIQILRIFLSFHILVFHCINKKLYKSKLIKIIIKDVSIDLGIFFIISFFYSYNSFTLRNILKIKQRFYRLLIPYIIWPNVFFVINNLTFYIYRKKSHIKLIALYYQLLIGNGIHGVFWFQFNLIFLSLFFIIIIFISKERYLLYLFLIGILLYLFLYSSYYNKFFPITFLFFSIRPIFKTYIYSFFGFILFPINIDDELKKYRQKSLFICFIIFNLFIYYNNLYGNNNYFFMIKVLGCINIFIFFLILPLNEIKNNIIINIIKLLTRYTGGIYYLHTKVQLLLEYFFIKKKSKTVIVCIINYLICYFICLIGSKIFRNYYIRYLFI